MAVSPAWLSKLVSTNNRSWNNRLTCLPPSSYCSWVVSTHLGFPAYFRVEVSWAKLAGVVVLLAPLPARLKEWAYASFAIDLGSALIAYFAVGDGPEHWSWAAATAVLWGFSYGFWRLLQSKPAVAS